MSQEGTRLFEAGNYHYIPAVFQYSAGVRAQDGYEIERVRFRRPVPIADAFAFIEAWLERKGRPPTAFAQCELRSPEPMSSQGFLEFNREYIRTLEAWGIWHDEINPVARTNVCPMYDPPAAPAMHAFSYTVPCTGGQAPSFVLAGGGDARGGTAPYDERIVRLHDTSPEGLREKVAFVIREMERRLGLLGCGWEHATATQAYTVQDIGHLAGEMLASRGATGAGLNWVYARPPVIGLTYEMDVRGVRVETMAEG